MRHIILFMAFTICASFGYSQSEKKRIRNGNNEYKEGNFQEAEKEYRKALMEKPGYTKGTFNLGDAMYEQENYEESNKLFTEVTEREANPEQRSAAYYNLGNSLMKENKYKESIEEFKKSLRLNPDNANTKYNLEYARKKLNEQQQQQNQDQNQDQDKKDQDKKDQDKQDQDKKDKEKKDNKDQEKQDNKDNQDQNKKDQNQGDQEKEQQQKQQPQQISKQDAQRMLDALKNDEKNTLQKLQKQKAKAVKGKKSDIDW